MSVVDVRDHGPPSGPPERNTGRIALWILLGLAAAAAVVAVLAAVLLAASGSDDESSETGAAETEAEAPTATSEQAPTTSSEAAITSTTVEATVTSSTAESSGTTASEPASCSAHGLDGPTAQPDLPAPVAEKRAAILSAATSCDLDGLVALAGPDFTAGFGGGDAVELWTELEAGGEQPMRFLVGILDLLYGTITGDGQTLYVWPAAHSYDDWLEVSAADRSSLEELYTPEELASFDEFGGYFGYRAGIDQDGNWIYFVAGD